MAKQNLISKQPFKGKTALVCGGSKGIGKETAKEIVRLGGSVGLIARGANALNKAAAEAGSLITSGEQFIEAIACDTTDIQTLEPLIKAFIDQHGVPDYLINGVGYAFPKYVQDLQFEDFQKNMETNYYGQLVPTLILLPYFMQEKKGHIAFISSMMGFMGIVGYATYAPSKFALVGLAEVLRHELKPHHISISLLYPPDTETPGFETENLTKPPETAMLSETAKLFSPEEVAEGFVTGLLKKKFQIVLGEGRWIWTIFRIFPRLVHAIIDQDYRKAREKVAKTT